MRPPKWRRTQPGAGIVLAILLCLIAAASTAADTPEPGSAFFGIQMRDNTAEQAALPLAGQAGIQWIRMNLRWSVIQNTDADPPVYDWSRYDTLIGNAANAGFSLILTIRDNPAWAATTACGPIDRVSTDRFVAFVAAAVARYSQPPYQVKLWELYNEPDNNHTDMPQQGGCWGQYPTEYASLLSEIYPAVKAADPASQLVLGGLAYDFFEGVDEGGLFNPDFLDAVLGAPGGASFDIMNFHYYRAFHLRWDEFGRDVIGKTTHLRDALARYQLSKPIMVSEIGHPSAGPISDGQDYSDTATSRYVLQAHARGLAAGLHSMIWFEMVDSSVEPRKYGLLAEDLSAKPAYGAYQTLTEQLDGLPYVRDDSAGDLEVYVFDAGDRQKTVCWSNSAITQTLNIHADVLRVLDMYGQSTSIADGDSADADGARNGSIRLAVGQDPVYAYPMLPADLPVKTYLPLIWRAGL
jgi:hypothetical protein